MELEQLRQYEDSLKCLYCDGDEQEFLSQWDIVGLSSFKTLHDNHLCFVKNNKFWLRLLSVLESQDQPSQMGLVIDEKFAEKLKTDQVQWEKCQHFFAAVLSVANVDLAISKLSLPFYELQYEGMQDLVDGRQMGSASIDPTAKISQNVFIGENVIIGAGVEILPGVVIMNGAKIGENTKLYPNITICENVEIGKNCRVHSGTVIGSDGFGYNFHQGIHHKVWHLGSVVIGDDVEIGSNVSVDRGTFDNTFIGNGTKIDNQVQIAHNCNIGQGVVLCGQSALAGSSTVGDYCVFGGRAGLGPDFKLGKGCQVAAGAMISHDWPDGSVIAGHPARPLQEWMKGLAALRKLALGKNK